MDGKAALTLPAFHSPLVALEKCADGFPRVQTRVCATTIVLLWIAIRVHIPGRSNTGTARLILSFLPRTIHPLA